MQADEVNIWKTKQILKFLKAASGNGTSMVSLVLPPGESIAKMNQKLEQEYGTATNIKSRVNRLSVQSAIVSAQQRLKLYSRCPSNGLCIFYAGEVCGDDKKARKVVIDFEPFKPINHKMYLCDNKFHVEAIEDMLLDERTYAFIIVDGNGYTLATLAGNTREVVDEFDVDLPSKTRRGGQSSNRFARLRDEAKHEYVKKVCEKLKNNLIKGEKVPYEGIIIAGNADIKHELYNSAMLEPRIRAKVMEPLLDVSYGGLNGLNQAIDLSKEKLGNVKFVEEKKVLEDYFEQISRDGNITFGVKDTMNALEGGAVETLILWENLRLERCVCELTEDDGSVASTSIVYTDEGKTTVGSTVVVKENAHVVERTSLLDWLVENREKFGANIKFVSDATTEGSQFVRGFGGVGAVLRYKLDMSNFADEDGDDDDAYYSE